MFYFILIAVNILIFNNLISQPKEINYSNWIFGKKAGINFKLNDNSQYYISYDSIFSYEGVSTFSDDKGRLNLICDGFHLTSISYWNNITVQTSFNLGSYTQDYSSSQSNIILPSLTNENEYFIFFVGDTKNQKKLVYRKFYKPKIFNDVKDLGFFVEEYNVVNENVGEQIAVLYNNIDNCYDIFVVERGNSTGIILYNYRFNENEEIKLISSFKFKNEMNNISGQLNISQDGQLIAFTNSIEKTFSLLKYKDKTFLEPIIESYKFEQTPYGVEFSDNSNNLFISLFGNSNLDYKVVSMNLEILNSNSIISSQRNILETSDLVYGSIKSALNGKIYITTLPIDKDNFQKSLFDPDEGYLTIINNPNDIPANFTYDKFEFPFGRSPINGLITKPVILNNNTKKPNFVIDYPNKICFGQEIDIDILSNESSHFDFKIFDITEDEVLLFDSTASNNKYNFELNPITPNNKFKHFKLIANKLFRREYDTLYFTIEGENCCINTVKNNSFDITSNNLQKCEIIDFSTEYNFRESEFSPCPTIFTNKREIAISQNASENHPNFKRTSFDNNSNLLVGNPPLSQPLKAWYQNNPTRKGERYRFSALVSNVEEIPRGNRIEGKTLNFWLSVKDRFGVKKLKELEDVKYNNGWIELSDEFKAEDISTELSIWVESKDIQNEDGVGFGIDLIILENIEDYNLQLMKDTLVCAEEDFQLTANFDNKFLSASWSPTENLNNPDILNPIANIKESTTYTVKIIDKFYCEHTNFVFIDIDQCNPCIPNLDIHLENKEVNIGEEFCIEGIFYPECENDLFLENFILQFEYNPKQLVFISASTSYTINTEGETSILNLYFDDFEITENQENTFNFCFSGIFENSNFTEIKAVQNENINQLYSKDARINFLNCDLEYRKFRMITVTDFETYIENKTLKIFLSTEQKGKFEFLIVDINGEVIKEFSFATTKDEYKNEEVIQIDLKDISSGTYFIRMILPDGKFITKQIILID